MGRVKKQQNQFGRSFLERQMLSLGWRAIKYPEQDGLHWGGLKLGKWQKCFPKLGINRLGQQSRVVKRGSFLALRARED